MQASQLQRRPGRRRSNPSPTSPGFPRRHGRPSDLFIDRDAPSAPLHSESPSIDLKFPSPTFDVDAFSPATKNEDHVTDKPQSITRVSADYGRHRPRLSAELNRPATSSAGLGLTGVTTTRPVQSPDSGYRTSPAMSANREFGEAFSRSTSRELHEDGPGPAVRTFSSPNIQTERVLADEFANIKASNAKRSRLNLLNPMSLLARRKSSQNTTKFEEAGLRVNTLHVPAIPDNLDPSIRGTIVHDFSTPRNRRINNESSPHSGVLPSPGYPRRPSDVSLPPTQQQSSPSQPSNHSPYFREHFQDDRTTIDPTNTAYLHTGHLQAPSASNLPTFAKRLPLTIPDQKGSLHEKPLPPLIKAHEAEDDVSPPPPDQPPPPPPKRTPSPVLNIPPPSHLPKHMTSTSSRFSFQLGGQGSLAQERLLEERHKKHASKQPETVEEPPEDEFGDFDYDADDFEERIPGVNADYDDDDDGFNNDDIEVRNIDLPSSKAQENLPLAFIPEFEEEPDFDTEDVEVKDINEPTNRFSSTQRLRVNTNHRQSLQAFRFTPDQMLFSPTSTHMTSEPTPRDSEGFPIGLAESQDSTLKNLPSDHLDESAHSPEAIYFSGLRISTGNDSQQYPQALRKHEPFDDNDLYFDDGEFDHDAIESGVKFDESWLDDESGRIHDIPAENARRYDEALKRNVSRDPVPDSPQSQSVTAFGVRTDGDNKRESISRKNQQGLTEDNLAAYHDALAFAANKAAEDGKFDRSVSFDVMPDDEGDSPFYNSQPGKSSNGSRHSHNFHSSGVSDDDAFGFDDDMDDDAMIAAANAEALENDDEGFYGQEFGFYARARGKDAADMINGGFFSSRGANGVKRSHSGKANFQEPSLTPITERSEWSTRNSVASLPIHGGVPGSAQSLPSPGIAQLLELDSPLVEDEMTLSALLKLRRGAFGGSQSSISSIGDRHNSASSPLAHVSGYNFSAFDNRTRTMSSPAPAVTNAMSIAESEDEDEEMEPRTMVQNTPQKKNVSPSRRMSQDYPVSSPMSRAGGSHHSRASSGAESVSYARESDGRWVLERRRTGDSGEVELVGREYLAMDARI